MLLGSHLTVLLVGLLVGFFWGCIDASDSVSVFDMLMNASFIAWAGVAANLLVVFIALFLNLGLECYRAPKFRGDWGASVPYQILMRYSYDAEICFTRLCITNRGRTAAEACEVRVERVYCVMEEADQITLHPLQNHDPRPLKWVGRSPEPIPLNRGSFDFVDLGVRRSDSMGVFRLEFEERGNLDLALTDDRIRAFRLVGAVYGMKAKPREFAIHLKWGNEGKFGPVQIEGAY